jgi:hypothetical protein
LTPLLAYDRPFFPDDRGALPALPGSHQPGAVALGVLQDGKLAGYGVLRPCRSGFKIGPLFADSPALAERLFTALKARAPAGRAAVPGHPHGPRRPRWIWCSRHCMTQGFETARMYAGGAPQCADGPVVRRDQLRVGLKSAVSGVFWRNRQRQTVIY